MLINGIPRRSLWLNEEDPGVVRVIDQRRLPFVFATCDLATLDDAIAAIRDMIVRGAPLIGITAAYGLALAARNLPSGVDIQKELRRAADRLRGTRPTAVNLAWALGCQLASVVGLEDRDTVAETLFRNAAAMADADVEACRMIGEHGLPIIEEMSRRKGGATVNILTHCNAGWLACVDHGTATAPIYRAHDAGIDLHVWVDETRPRNQGGRLTAWELAAHGVPHTVVVDNAGGHLMQRGLVDMVLVGCDRATATGDVCNKIGTYLKALAARDNAIPFYVALPTSSIDTALRDGLAGIPIEERSGNEVACVQGWSDDGAEVSVRVVSPGSQVANPGFDITPARLVTGMITETGYRATAGDSRKPT